MLTIEQLRAMSAANREGYLRQCFDDAKRRETKAETLLDLAADYRAGAKRCTEEAEAFIRMSREARAYFATLEAAGLWPVAAPGGER